MNDVLQRPMPTPRPPRADIAFARPRYIDSVAIAFADRFGPVFRFHAVSTVGSWSGEVEAASIEAAVLDVITLLRMDEPGMDRVRFLVDLGAASRLWRHAPEVSALLPGTTIEMPRAADRPLMDAAEAALAPGTATPANPDSRSDPTLSSVVAATDGSVRGKFTGYGWLASTGEYGLCGFRHSAKQIGSEVVLIAELRAMAGVVRKLHSRHITVLSDSQDAIAMAERWMSGDENLPEGYTTERADGRPAGLVAARQHFRAQRNRLKLTWVKGHQGHPLNEGADALARLARRYAAGAKDLTAVEYHRRAAGLAGAFAAEFRRKQVENP